MKFLFFLTALYAAITFGLWRDSFEGGVFMFSIILAGALGAGRFK